MEPEKQEGRKFLRVELMVRSQFETPAITGWASKDWVKNPTQAVALWNYDFDRFTIVQPGVIESVLFLGETARRDL